MRPPKMSRRDHLRFLGTSAAALTGSAAGVLPLSNNAVFGAEPALGQSSAEEQADRERRMKWWHQARFGMFIHWGLYAVIGQHEWAMEMEGIPVAQYQQLAKHFTPKPHAAREWAKLAKRAGQKYMVMTTKHHEGFCMFDTKLTNYCAPQQACGRDLVAEFVEAARAEGLRVGFYYSLMDWHHPDGWRCSTDEAARGRFVEYTHGLIRELMTQYGKVDILWYDGAWPLNTEQWEAEKMNKMVYQLQPDIIINNRNGLPGDFSTPEQHIEPANSGRAWETCMTLNGSWGYQKADRNWKTPETIVLNLITCARDAGNYLLNIGPQPDGSVPEGSVRTLTEVGEWMDRNSPTIYQSEPCKTDWHVYACYTRRGNTLYMHISHWPGETPASNWLEFFNPPSVVAIGGLRVKVKSARLFASGKPVSFEQGDDYVRFTDLPIERPDNPVAVLAIECDGEPIIDSSDVRKNRKREGVGI